MKDKKILVTGSAGFIGSHLVNALLNKGCYVTGIDNLYNGKKDNIKDFIYNKKFNFIEGDIRNFKLLDKIMKNIDYVFHEAALIDIEESFKNPIMFNSVNVEGTLNILWSSYKNHIKKIIFASSAAVYGESDELPTSENVILNPISPYGLQKKICEEYFYLFHKLYGINYVILRYFNVYGSNKNPLLPYIGVISKFILNVLYNKKIIVFGDGEQTRDFVFIDDVINANLLSVNNPNANNKIFNIASGQYINMTKLSKLIIKVCQKKDIIIEHDEKKIWEVFNSQADITFARQILKYNPKTDLKEGIYKTLKWQLERAQKKEEKI